MSGVYKQTRRSVVLINPVHYVPKRGGGQFKLGHCPNIYVVLIEGYPEDLLSLIFQNGDHEKKLWGFAFFKKKFWSKMILSQMKL